MIFLSLEMQGFKSFPDKTKITFDKGVTAIIGPNGSGKSNISDAIRWVLGEMSVKSLRGTKMEDVIFSGSSKRRPLGVAEVTLNFDNSDHALDIDFDEDNLLIKFEHKMDYIDENHPNETSVMLEVEGEKSHIDLGTTENNIIKIPFDKIANKKQVKIKISYSSDNFKKETYLTNNNRQTLSFDDFDLDIGIGLYKHLIIDYVPKHDGHINLSEVIFDGNIFRFSGKCNIEIREVFIKNIITFEKIYYPVTYENDEFNFMIPLEDILNAPIKKWELNCDDCLNSIEIIDNKLIYLQHNRIRIFNTRNKIMISNVIYNYCDELESMNEKVIRLKHKNNKLKEKNAKLKAKNNKLKEKNANLKDKNKQLKDLVNEYQSRKVLKIADKFKL